MLYYKCLKCWGPFIKYVAGRGQGGWSVQKRTGAYRGGVMEREYVRSLTSFLLFFFALKCADFTNT